MAVRIESIRTKANSVSELMQYFLPIMQKTSEETKSTASTTKTVKTSDGAGRPEKADSEKSEKTIQNKESM